jgi:DNA-directed RNA polymerase subunit beta'
MLETTTIGHALVNDALPPEFRAEGRSLGKKEADALLEEIAAKYPEKYKEISFALQKLGSEAAFDESTTLSIDDLAAPFDRAEMVAHVEKQERRIEAEKDLTPEEKEQALEVVYADVQKYFTDQTMKSALGKGNPFALQVKSKSRGSPSQLTALLTSPVVFQDANDHTIPVFVRNSFAEGLEPHEYWAATYGARKGVISTKFATRDAGYLGKMFNAAVQPVVVTEGDCGTPYGMPTKADDADNIGAVLSRPVGRFPAGTVITKHVLAEASKNKLDELVVRSPTVCSSKQGVCKQCVGARDGGEFPEIGHHIGLNAASALAERIAQSSLNVKHSGGLGDGKERVYAGFDVIKELAEVPQNFPHRALVAELDGKVEKIEEAPQGGYNVTINDTPHYVGVDLPLRIKEGDEVEAGDQISGGILNPADVVRHKGIGEGRRYFADRLTQAFRDSGLDANRRNVEVLSRALIDHVAIQETEGMGHYLPGDVVSYANMAHTYKPRRDAVHVAPQQAVGKYLESPALHHTLGTRITKKMATQLKKHGVGQVMAHQNPPGFVSNMVSVVKVPEFTDDWMARLSSNYLKTRLLDDVQRGSTSNIHGLHPVPGLAKGVEFGRQKGKDFTF